MHMRQGQAPAWEAVAGQGVLGYIYTPSSTPASRQKANPTAAVVQAANPERGQAGSHRTNRISTASGKRALLLFRPVNARVDGGRTAPEEHFGWTHVIGRLERSAHEL